MASDQACVLVEGGKKHLSTVAIIKQSAFANEDFDWNKFI